MIELYVDNNKVDLSENIDINITYTSLDVSNPTAIKNSFSKTIKIPGTPNNNTLFGNIWRIDRLLIEDPNKLIGVNFDTRKRVAFTILNSGAVVESGYMQLNNILINNGIITYEITLYGGLGDFFYNLMYNDDGSEKTLYDLYWCWKSMMNGSPGEATLSRQAEDFDNIYTWNAKSIAQSWACIKPFMEAGELDTYYQTRYRCVQCGHIQDTDLEPCEECGNTTFTPVQVSGSVLNAKSTCVANDITAIPTYNGLTENFTNDKVLVSKKSVLGGLMSNDIKNYLGNKLPSWMPVTGSTDAYTFGMNYTLDETDSYGMLSAARELDKFEAKDMRVKYMNIGLRLQKFLERISDPDNNGGYEVVWDDKVLESPYYGYSWIILGKPDFSEETTSAFSASNNNILTVNSNGTYNTEVRNLILRDGTSQVSSISLTGIDSPQITLKYRPVIATNGNIPSLLYNHYGTYEERGSHDTVVWTGAYWPILCVTTYIKEGSNYIYSKTIGYSLYQNEDTRSVVGTFGTNELFPEADAIAVIRNYVNTHIRHGNNSDYYEHKLVKFALDGNNIVAPEATVSTSLSNTYTNITIENVVNIVTFNMTSGYGTAQLNVSGISEPTTFELFGTSGRLKPVWPANKYVSITPLLTSSAIGNIGGTSNINVLADKRTLLGNTKSPFKYLTDFTKLLNLKYIYDKVNKKITIVPIDKYYLTDSSEWMTGLIDRSREIKINAQAIEYKTLTIDLDSDKDCYPVYLYNKSYHKPFASKTIDTGNEFTDKNLDLLDGSIYKEGSPYRQGSIYYDSTFSWLPSPARQNNYTWSLYSVSGDTYVCDTNTGIPIYQHDYAINSPGNYGNLVVGAQLANVDDLFPKLAQFDKDNKYDQNTENTFVFLNGYIRNWKNYYNNTTSQYDTVAYYGLSDPVRIMTTLTGNECYLYEYTNDFSSTIAGAPFRNSIYPWNIPNFSKNLTSRFIGNPSLHTHYGNYWWPYLTSSSMSSYGFWASWYIDKPVVESWPETNVNFVTNCSTMITSRYTSDWMPSYTYGGNTLSQWNVPQSVFDITDDSIYTRFWKNYLNDLYDKNTKEITVYLDLKHYIPEDALRKIWIIDGTAFIITKIHDYSPVNTHKFCKTTLRKVTDINNYTNVNYGGEGKLYYFDFSNYSESYTSTVPASATTANTTFMTNYPSLYATIVSPGSGDINMVYNTITAQFPANTGYTVVNWTVNVKNPSADTVGTWTIKQAAAPQPSLRTWNLINTTSHKMYVVLTTNTQGPIAYDIEPGLALMNDGVLPFNVTKLTVLVYGSDLPARMTFSNGVSSIVLERGTSGSGIYTAYGNITVETEHNTISITQP